MNDRGVPERVTYSEDLLRDLLEEGSGKEYLVHYGLPATNIIFSATDAPYILEAGEPSRSCLVIGWSTAPMLVGIDRRTGQVVVINNRVRQRFWHANSGVRNFVASIEEFDRKYPVGGYNPTTERLRADAQSLRAKLLEIDATSFSEEGGFWPTLLTDVVLGDYTETAGGT
jgi:hypothetical protein